MSENNNNPQEAPIRFRFAGEDLRDSRAHLDARYTGPVDSLPDEDAKVLSTLHACETDKFYRMHAQSSCSLVSYRDGVVELELRCRAEHYRSRLYAVHNQIRDWARQKLLACATRYVVHIYLQNSPAGFCIPGRQATPERLQQEFKALDQPLPDVKVDEIRGDWRDLVCSYKEHAVGDAKKSRKMIAGWLRNAVERLAEKTLQGDGEGVEFFRGNVERYQSWLDGCVRGLREDLAWLRKYKRGKSAGKKKPGTPIHKKGNGRKS